jgi:hypothetical protein
LPTDEAIDLPVARQDESTAPHLLAEASRRNAARNPLSASEGAVSETRPEEPQSRLEPTQVLPELALVDPQDDPGDLFEPLTGAAPPIAEATSAESRSGSEMPARAAPVRGRSPAAAADPLAVMGAFGAEELLALFT